jgi:prepilin-type processing-associated H-X9-DG protein
LYYAAYTTQNDYRLPPIEPRKLFIPTVLPPGLHRYRVEGDPLNTQLEELHAYKELLLCPAARRAPPHPSFLGGGSTHTGWVTSEKDRLMLSSYGQNGWMPTGPTDPNAARTARPAGGSEMPAFSWVTCLVKGAGAVPVYSDCKTPCGYPRPGDAPPEYDEAPADSMWSMQVYAMNRHNGGINSLFLDWSARKVGLKELWTLKWTPGFETAGRWTKAGGVQPEQWPPWMRRFKDY